MGHRGTREAKKRTWGALNGQWVPHDTRDEVVDFVRVVANSTEVPVTAILGWAELPRGKFYDWRERYGRVNEHNASIPRDHWLTPDERQKLLDYHDKNPLEGYRRLAFMAIDDDIVAASPTSVYRVLHKAGRLDRWHRRPSTKGAGFQQPLRPHDHWHIDIAYINVAGTFFYLCSIIDGCSRFVVHWEIRESMKEHEVELILERAREKFPGVSPRIISDNGPQFIANDFKSYIRLVGMTHVRITPGYPQSNGKQERFHKTLKSEAIRVTPPSSLEHARAVVERFVDHYNHRRLHSAIGYVPPVARLEGRHLAIQQLRDQRLEAARQRRADVRQALRVTPTPVQTDQPRESGSR